MRVMYFSMVRELVKKDYEDIEFSGSVAELKEYLSSRYPEIRELISGIKFAVNEEYVGDDYILKGEERVALIPPVSGG